MCCKPARQRKNHRQARLLSCEEMGDGQRKKNRGAGGGGITFQLVNEYRGGELEANKLVMPATLPLEEPFLIFVRVQGRSTMVSVIYKGRRIHFSKVGGGGGGGGAAPRRR